MIEVKLVETWYVCADCNRNYKPSPEQQRRHQKFKEMAGRSLPYRYCEDCGARRAMRALRQLVQEEIDEHIDQSWGVGEGRL